MICGPPSEGQIFPQKYPCRAKFFTIFQLLMVDYTIKIFFWVFFSYFFSGSTSRIHVTIWMPMKNEKKEKKKNDRFSSFDAVLKITTSPKLLTFFINPASYFFNHSIAVFFHPFINFISATTYFFENRILLQSLLCYFFIHPPYDEHI